MDGFTGGYSSVVRVTPFGAAQAVGRSCVLLELAGAWILLDCGIFVSAEGEGHVPDFAALMEALGGASLNERLDVVLISHSHLDHIGALPYLTEVLGYDGPVLMTHPARALAPMFLEDYLKVRRIRGRTELYTKDQIASCFTKVECIQLRERFLLGDIIVTPFYAGHILGAVMFLVEHRGRSALYTGDFTVVPDNQLSAASVPLALRPDVMITEATCCTTIRISKRTKEQEICRTIQRTLEQGGKVLVPIAVMGKMQDFILLCEKHWVRAGLDFPIYIPRGMAEKTIRYLRLFASWTSDAMRNDTEAFVYPHVREYSSLDDVAMHEPIVLLASPGGMSDGRSLECFRRLAPDSKNLIVFPGYCLPGTVANDVLGGSKRVKPNDGGPFVDVNCSVDYLTHSDHTDARGLLQMIAQVAPRHVILVHGDGLLMNVFKPIVQCRLRVPCSDPPLGETVEVSAERDAGTALEIMVSPRVLLDATVVPPPPPPPPSEVGGKRRRFGASLERPPLAVQSLRLLSPDISPADEGGKSVIITDENAATFRGVLNQSQSGRFELHTKSPMAIPRHRIRFRHVSGETVGENSNEAEPQTATTSVASQEMPELCAVLQAWACLELWLKAAGIPHSWSPAPLACSSLCLTNRERGPPCAYFYELQFLNLMVRLRLQVVGLTTTPNTSLRVVVAGLLIEWTREDIQLSAEVQPLSARMTRRTGKSTTLFPSVTTFDSNLCFEYIYCV